MSTHNIKLAIEVSEQLTNLCKKLSGSDGDVWFREFGKFLKKEPAWEKPVIFKVIEMGIHKNLESYLKDFKKNWGANKQLLYHEYSKEGKVG
jgi:hypothetical protein